MSIWTRIGDALSALRAGEGLGAVLDALREAPERSVAFTIAVIALGAKLAKADGHVTRGEVAAFREVFHIPASEEQAAARVFNLARQDVAGFESYAARVGRMFEPGDPALMDLINGLFHIAMADGRYDPSEDEFLSVVAERLGLSQRDFRRVRAAHVPEAEEDAWDVLGVDPSEGMEAARAAWRAEVRETHPDRLIARGLPEEAVKLAEKRLIAVNRAWEEISGAAREAEPA